MLFVTGHLRSLQYTWSARSWNRKREKAGKVWFNEDTNLVSRPPRLQNYQIIKESLACRFYHYAEFPISFVFRLSSWVSEKNHCKQGFWATTPSKPLVKQTRVKRLLFLISRYIRHCIRASRREKSSLLTPSIDLEETGRWTVTRWKKSKLQFRL